MLFGGTLISRGSALGLVTGTGVNTEIGKINAGVQDAKLTEMKTPLTEKLDEFAGQLTTIIAGICVATWALNIPKFSNSMFESYEEGAIHYAKVAVALGVAAIPEGLPA
eukprot:gene3747-4671_t